MRFDSSHTPAAVQPTGRFYGRRKGRPLHVRKNALVQTLLPQLQITLPEQGALDPLTLFEPRPHAVWMEIGFGGGEHVAEQAARNPAIGLIGCEPFLNGVASLLDHLDRRNLKNVRIFPDDARKILDALPEACVDRCYVLFADPWPKARHTERRFIGAENLPRLARVLKAGAELRLATDVVGLADWMREHVAANPAFEPILDGSVAPPDWFPTRYEEKGRAAGRQPLYLTYRRR